MSVDLAGAIDASSVAELVDDIDGFAAQAASFERSWQVISQATSEMSHKVALLPQVLDGPKLQAAFAELMIVPDRRSQALHEAARQYAQLGRRAASDFDEIARDRARLVADIADFHNDAPAAAANHLAGLAVGSFPLPPATGDLEWHQVPELVHREAELRGRTVLFNARLDATLDSLAASINGIHVDAPQLPELTPIGMLSAGVQPDALAAMAHCSVEQLCFFLTADELETALRANPELRTWVQTRSAEDAATLWGHLDPSQQNVLIQTIPSIIGSLDGIPAEGRVRANRINAERLIPTVESRIANLQRKIDGYGEPDVDVRGTDPGNRIGKIMAAREEEKRELAVLERELKFAREVAAPDSKIQMYLFDPDRSRMIQMLGTPGPETKHVITYIPGTYTSVDSFYNHSVEKLPGALQRHHESDTVVFIWKDGQFPGEDDKTGAADPARIVEANDEKRGMEAGKRIAEFQSTINTADPVLASAIRAGVGFSWGLVGVTGSEAAGAYYDQVFSASGAGMPSEWKANPKTKYYDFSHIDILQEAQWAGVVWNGRNPRVDPAFSHGFYYPEDGVPIGVIDGFVKAVAAHDLTATDLPANRDLINDVKMKLYGK